MKNKLIFSNLLDNNRVLRVLSVFLAFIAWLVVAITIDDTRIEIIDNVPIKINTTDLNSTLGARKLSVIEGAEQTISVRVEGISYIIGNLTPDDVVATPILTSIVDAGEQEVQIMVTKADPNANFKIASHTPTVKLNFDRITTKTFPLSVDAPNIRVAEGYLRQSMTASPSEFSISGPETQIARISRCVLEYEGDEILDDTKVFPGKLVFYDANGEEISPSQLKNLSYAEQQHEITITVWRRKEVPVHLSFINVPQGLDTSSLKYTLSAETVTIAGPKEIVDKREEVTVGPIDFSKISIGSSFILDLNLDAAETCIDGITNVNVEIDSESLAKKTITITNITSRNKPAGYDVAIKNTEIANVNMVGNTDDIEKLTEKDLIAVVDLRNVDQNTWRVPVSIYATGNKFVWAVGEYYVNVTVTEK